MRGPMLLLYRENSHAKSTTWQKDKHTHTHTKQKKIERLLFDFVPRAWVGSFAADFAPSVTGVELSCSKVDAAHRAHGGPLVPYSGRPRLPHAWECEKGVTWEQTNYLYILS